MSTEDEITQRVESYRKTASAYDKIIYAVIAAIFTFFVSALQFSDELIIDESLYSTIGSSETVKNAHTEQKQRAKDNYDDVKSKSNILNITLFLLSVSAMYLYVLATRQRNNICPSWDEFPDKYNSFNFIDKTLPGLMLLIIIPLLYIFTMQDSGMAALGGYDGLYNSAEEISKVYLFRIEFLEKERNFFFLLHFIAVLPLLCTFIYTIIKRGNFVIQIIATLVSSVFVASIYHIISNAGSSTI